MRNIALLIAYDGTEFIGSQWQQQGRSVQGVIEAAWEQLSQEQCRVTFAGRTDAGVHAEGQVVHVSTATRHAPETIRRALNAYLPDDVAVLDVVEVEARFHARYSAISREYRYLIDNSAVAAPLLRHCSLHVSYPLDVGAMHFSLRGLVGRHDFASFTTAAARQTSTVRTVHRVGCSTVEFCGRELIAIEIEANAFLYNMVRAIVGTVLEVGTGQRTSAAFAEILERRDRQAAGKTAPPHGLTLVRVGYPPEQLRWGGTR